MAIGRLIDALASVRRISAFLDAEEALDDSVTDHDQEHAISVDRASFTWEQSIVPLDTGHLKRSEHTAKSATDDVYPILSDHDETAADTSQRAFTLDDINLSIGRKELIVVIGSIGSGKSSLLSALAGDMRGTNGSLSFGGSRALCSQYPWIQNTSVKQNITFGREFDQSRYNAVVHACALQQDIEILPDGDSTEIGEKGVTLSGGQKQRLSLARAVYFDADIILMDDPLSAVDAHVGRHIVDHAICGLLQDKCRILATHQLHVLPRADKIIWLKNGRVHKFSTYQELIEGDREFQMLMRSTETQPQDSQDREATLSRTLEHDDAAVEVAGASESPIRALMQVEERAAGSISWKVYAAFIRGSGSLWNLVLVGVVLSVAQGANIFTTIWLSWWVSGKFVTLQTPQYIGIYAALGVFQAVLMFVFATTLTTLCARAGKAMLNKAISHTIGSPISFFDTTPIGRITNRFSKDVDTMDNQLTDDLRFLLYLIATIISVFCLTIAYYYYFAIALIPLGLAFALAASYYRATAREIKRHESVLRSHVFARFGEMISGIPTIRAYGVQAKFLASMSDALDSMDGAYFLTFAGQRWLSTHLDMVGVLLIFVVGILIVTSRFSVDPATGGVVLSYMLSIVQLLQETVHTFADVENEMNSVERLYQYGHELEQEEDVVREKQNVPAAWPGKGEIHFDNVQMRYRDGLALSLKGLNVHVNGGERIGIVGRTGAGKSSVIAAMFRLVELSEGRISMDGVDISSVSLQGLRSRLSIIPQDPTLFRGTLRSNLDPFDEYDDTSLWHALRQANFITDKDTLTSSSGAHEVARVGLDLPVEDEGLNFSLGQRQLLALARVLLKNSQVIMFDEATSSVDFETDEKLQQVIHHAFRGKTLLCIAHRLKTVIRGVVSKPDTSVLD
jgi:ABC-type multidrug transport system fused ATPase/permease subunit